MTNLDYDAMAVMEQIQMAESRHMQMGALVSQTNFNILI